MRQLRLRFTIGSLMIAVAVVAVLLALPDGWGVIVLVLTIPCLALVGAQWLVFRGHRRLAAVGFWGLAFSINALYVVAGIAPDLYLYYALLFEWLVIVAPTLGGLGAAWAVLASREGAVPRRRREMRP